MFFGSFWRYLCSVLLILSIYFAGWSVWNGITYFFEDVSYDPASLSLEQEALQADMLAEHAETSVAESQMGEIYTYVNSYGSSVATFERPEWIAENGDIVLTETDKGKIVDTTVVDAPWWMFWSKEISLRTQGNLIVIFFGCFTGLLASGYVLGQGAKEHNLNAIAPVLCLCCLTVIEAGLLFVSVVIWTLITATEPRLLPLLLLPVTFFSGMVLVGFIFSWKQFFEEYEKRLIR